MNDQDIQLLESYLDDELTSRELESLRQRLSAEPYLSAAIDELRSQREMRQSFFAACQPDEASVQRLIQSAKRQATRETVWGERNRALRWVSGLAACLVFGFVAGRGLRSNSPAPVDNSGPTRVAQNLQPPTDNTQIATDDRIRFDGPRIPVNGSPNNGGSIDFNIRNPGVLADVGKLDPFPGDRIFIVDANGRLVQRFDSHEQYMKFVEQKLSATTEPSSLAP